MERAIKLLGQSKLAEQCLSGEKLAIAAWERAVGEKVARHAIPVNLVRGRLVIDVEDLVWRQQLFPMTSQIVSRLAKVTGREDLVTGLEFRVGARRRMPGRETVPVRGVAPREEDRIADPILSRLYRASQKKESA